MWHPADETSGRPIKLPGNDEPTGEHGAIDADEAALDEFFDEGDVADERRFGGRLRRRR